MKLNYKITINATVPEKEIKNALSDEENCIALKELLLDELPKELEDLVVNVEKTEQHDAEIRKPLEDEIERLLQEIKDLECLVKLKEQSKQNVIAELEEWVEKASNNYISKFDVNGQDALFLVKQKLKEMKEARDE